MSELPKGWVGVPLNKIVDKIVGGGTPSKSVPSYYQGNIPWMTVKDMNKLYLTDTVDHITQEAVENSSTNIIPAGTPIIATRMSLGKIVRASFDSAINQDLKALFVNRELNDYYFEYWYRSQGMKIQSLGTGTTVKGVRLEVINALEFPLAPLAEQKRIVAKLDEVLAQVDTIKARLDRIPAILKRFRQSVLAAAVSGKLTEDWRVKNVGCCAESELNTNFSKKSGKLRLRGKQTNLSELSLLTLPSSWTWTQNYKLAKDTSNAICAGPFGTIFKAKDFRGEGVPIIFLRHVKKDGFNQNKPNYMDRAVWEEFHQEYSVNGGELLVTKLGDPPGECCIYPENAGTSMITPDVLKMDVDEQSAEKKYLSSYFNSPISTELIEKLAFGATRLRIDIAMFKGFPVPLPPIEEQKQIVRLVDQYFAFADTIEAQVKKAQARVDNLTQSILAKAFRGELVAQDANDEPADKLLERIAQARKEAEALAKVAKKTEKQAVKQG
ncbi:restriction endonuclease subunit S [Vibrio sp. 1151_11]|uniref:restriction endonuclease subunit S n=1 Tax=Vibrio sp. 1151_11 TaxID=2527670 RepID=UPI0024050CD9|nr:restriction endonuclease subunit S [Vibrio sp. 1151_11]MDF9387575.1 restriction endonuclease subunit S [Vibrio sp. 1151_11]